MGLCKYCKNWVRQCGVEPAHCMEKSRESHYSCDLTTNFAPYMPVEGLQYSRDEIIAKWTKHINEERND